MRNGSQSNKIVPATQRETWLSIATRGRLHSASALYAKIALHICLHSYILHWRSTKSISHADLNHYFHLPFQAWIVPQCRKLLLIWSLLPAWDLCKAELV